MIEIFELVRKVARHYTNALITGPTGCGKELIARALHELSPVSRERFAVCSCAALPDALLENQLFGYSRGAFSGATEARAGLFESTEGGTVFLDEIGEVSPAIQAKLLRVVEQRVIPHPASAKSKPLNVRVIASTNRNLRSDISAGRFREDLFYRLANIEIRVPGLTERMDDIPVLVQHFLKRYNRAYDKKFQGFTQRAQIALLQHDWPGSVRELENVISSAAISADGDFIDVTDLPEYFTKVHRRGPVGESDWRPVPLDEIRTVHIQRVLETCKGNRVRAAQILGIGRTSLYRFLKRFSEVANGEGK
jgi:two-component system, NtrC family, response regulator HydG